MKFIPIIFLLLQSYCFAQTWLQISDLPGQKRDDGVAAVVNNTLFFGTGLREGAGLGEDFYVFDLGTGTWTMAAPLPPGAQRQYAGAFSSAGGFFVVGGEGPNGPTGSMYRYDAASNSWTLKAAHPGPGLLGMCCLEFGDKVILVGGRLPNGALSDEVWEYTISADVWTQKNDVPFGGRWRASATVCNGSGYLLFGMDDSDAFRKELYAYNPAADTWSQISNFPGVGRTYATLQTVGDRLLVFAGIDTLNTYYKSLWFYDPAGGAWNQGPDLPAVGRKGGMGLVANSNFYYSCGIAAGDQRLNETWKLEMPLALATTQPLSTDGLLFPNPAGDFVSLRCSDPAEEIVLRDALGRQLRPGILQQNATETRIDLSGTAQGLYYLTWKCGGRSYREKLIRN